MADLTPRQKAVEKAFTGNAGGMSDSDLDAAAKSNPTNARLKAEQLKRRKKRMEKQLLESNEGY